MKLDELVEGVSRILDAATEKFNNLCEEKGIEPDDPILTGEDEENEEEEEGGAEGGESEETAGKAEDMNMMPQPEGDAAAQPTADQMAAVAAAPQVDGGAVPPEALAAAQSPEGAMPMPQEGMPAEVPVEGGEQPQQPTEDEEAAKKQQA